jgi:hypothetical protein
MDIVNRQTQARDAARRWKWQYPTDRRTFSNESTETTYQSLLKTQDPDEIDKIIGNDSWTRVPECSECKENKPEVVVVTNHDDVVFLCQNCLTHALSLFANSDGSR